MITRRIMTIECSGNADLIDSFANCPALRVLLNRLALENQVALVSQVLQPFIQYDIALPARVEFEAVCFGQTPQFRVTMFA
jgi:hypothetical protein